MKDRIKILLSLFLIIIFVFFGNVTNIWGVEDEIVYEPFVVISSYKVSDDIITPGKQFDLTIEVENTDKKVATRGLLMTIGFPDGISTAYGSSNQVFIDSLKPGEKREITIKLFASQYYARSTVPFGITFISEVRTNSATIYASVLLDGSLFKVVSQAIPEEAESGNKIAASISFKPLLEEKLSNVILSVYVDNDNKPVTSANIGNITVGASKTQDLTFFIYEKGQHSIRFELSYSNSEGIDATAELYSGKIQINESSGAKEQLINESKETNLNTSDKLVILGCLGLSALLGIGIILIAKKYN
ncbi:MAG: hypothetical protein IKN95_01035 [Lachnospiraceae bacterium]|nr:hypothetical protein [Lachnospiraceae bacterium]